MENNFFGYETGSPKYDGRRHLNTIFMTSMTYHLRVNPKFIEQVLSNKSSYTQDEMAYWIQNEILYPQEVELLKYIQIKCNLSDSEFIFIVSCSAVGDKIFKTPASYNKHQSQSLIIQLLLFRFLVPASPAITSVNTFIFSIAQGIIPSFSHQDAIKMEKELNDALKIYHNINDLEMIENYIIQRI